MVHPHTSRLRKAIISQIMTTLAVCINTRIL
jgi:hypothetical protein